MNKSTLKFEHDVMPSHFSRCTVPTVQFPVFRYESLPIAPAHFYVLYGLLLESPPEPRGKGIVAATASRVAVLSVPECVVGDPPPKIGRILASG